MREATSVINQIVESYKETPLLLVGHASSLGGDSPKGKNQYESVICKSGGY